jgi:hypothetical protein
MGCLLLSKLMRYGGPSKRPSNFNRRYLMKKTVGVMKAPLVGWGD